MGHRISKIECEWPSTLSNLSGLDVADSTTPHIRVNFIQSTICSYYSHPCCCAWKEEVMNIKAFIHKIKAFTHKIKAFTHVWKKLLFPFIYLFFWIFYKKQNKNKRKKTVRFWPPTLIVCNFATVDLQRTYDTSLERSKIY